MKNIIRFAVAGALMAGYATVQATPLPSSGNADLYLFVSDQSAGTTFAEDTGISVNSLLPSSDLSSGADLKSISSAVINQGPSSALTAYINAANSASQALEWGVEAIQYTSPTPTGSSTRPQGVEIGLTDNNLSSTKIASMNTSNLNIWSSDFESDAQYLGNIPTGGASYAWSSGSIAGNVWGAQGYSPAGQTNEYSQGPDQSGISLGTAAAFYGVTANGGTGRLESYVLGGSAGTIELTANGTLEAAGGSTSPVPLPPAVWLLGSGLLGLAGVGRRRAV